MKVLHLNSSLVLGGGLERIIVDLMTTNIKVSNYLCVINNRWSKEYIQQFEEKNILLCNRKEGTKNPIKNIKHVYKIYKFIKKNNIDTIHCHNIFSLKVAYLLKKILKVKVIFTVHSTAVYNANLNKYPVDKYIAISTSVFDIIKKYVSEDKIRLIYNGVDLKRFDNSSELSVKKSNSFNIACVARIMPEIKGQDILIKALNILKNQYNNDNFICTFAGASNEQQSMDCLYELTKKFGLESNINFIGNVEKIENLYANTDILVLPSRYEGFGLVVVEALAAGCSVIVSKLEGPLEIVKENQEYGLYFEKESYEDLAGKLDRLISDDEYRRRYTNNKKTLEYIESEYSLEKMVNSYNEVYIEV
ncbi:glycosyltransferase family 4 protein [Peribacillus sp. RS7]|uniref:glycosyltransferase family 4 protein n=1 Tax=Peribacillus sp. RS7 TaxID=3242679 RepID=UPI0035C01019